MVEITPEMQAQLDEQKKNCPFCKIIAGEIPAKKVYEDSKVTAILDINPWVKGHTLFMQKEHYPIMPYIPADIFKHMFGLIPEMIKALKVSMLMTGANVFIANGGVAGQQSPHFLIHLLPREKGDGIDSFAFDQKIHVEEDKASQVNEMLAKNIPIMMNNHFARNPTDWHKGSGDRPDYLPKTQFIYEDERSFVIVPDNPQGLGHLVIYSKEEEKDIENLDNESASHLFYVASFCATAVFEGLGAHGSNIILKSGLSDDNSDGMLKIHILSRFQDDGIDILPKPMKDKPNMDDIQAKIKDKTFMVEYNMNNNHESKKEIIDLDQGKVIVENKVPSYVPIKQELEIQEKKSDDPMDEVRNAIKRLR